MGRTSGYSLLRELEEEIGIVEIETFKVINVYSHVYKNNEENSLKPLHHLGIVYNVIIGSLDLSFENDGSTDRCEWFTKDQARLLPLTPAGEFAVERVWPEA